MITKESSFGNLYHKINLSLGCPKCRRLVPFYYFCSEMNMRFWRLSSKTTELTQLMCTFASQLVAYVTDCNKLWQGRPFYFQILGHYTMSGLYVFVRRPTKLKIYYLEIRQFFRVWCFWKRSLTYALILLRPLSKCSFAQSMALKQYVVYVSFNSNLEFYCSLRMSGWLTWSWYDLLHKHWLLNVHYQLVWTHLDSKEWKLKHQIKVCTCSLWAVEVFCFHFRSCWRPHHMQTQLTSGLNCLLFEGNLLEKQSIVGPKILLLSWQNCECTVLICMNSSLTETCTVKNSNIWDKGGSKEFCLVEQSQSVFRDVRTPRQHQWSAPDSTVGVWLLLCITVMCITVTYSLQMFF